MGKVKQKSPKNETDSAYFLKLVLYIVVGSQWLFIGNNSNDSFLPIPLGLILGLIFASHEHFRIDRKIEIALLLVTTLVGYWGAVGIQLIIG